MVDEPLITNDPHAKATAERLMAATETSYDVLAEQLGLSAHGLPFDEKKKITSALRRIAPNGQANEMGWSCNLRSLRHLLMMRTSRHAEREIRAIFNDVYKIIKGRYPLLVSDAHEEEVNGLLEISGMKMQQYDKTIDEYSLEELLAAATKKASAHAR
jgi:thymidylate synthase ThyX